LNALFSAALDFLYLTWRRGECEQAGYNQWALDKIQSQDLLIQRQDEKNNSF
jgi:hypothetical protein